MPSELDTHDLLFNPARRRERKPRSEQDAAGSTESAPGKTTPQTGDKPAETPRFAVARHIGGDEPEPLLSTRSWILLAVAVAAIAGAIFLFKKPKENPEAAAAATTEAPRPVETAPPVPTPIVSAAPPAASEAPVASASAQPAASASSASVANAAKPPAAKPIMPKQVGPVAPAPAAAPARAAAPKPAAAPAPASDNPYGDTPAPRKPAAAAPKSNDNPY